MKTHTTKKAWVKVILRFAAALIPFVTVAAFAAPSASQNLASVADNITSNFSALAKLITAAAYVAGFGFAFAAILKFKAHKDNPQQIPVGTPIALLFIGAALIFLPTLFGVTGSTVFGSGATAGGISGEFSVPGYSDNTGGGGK